MVMVRLAGKVRGNGPAEMMVVMVNVKRKKGEALLRKEEGAG